MAIKNSSKKIVQDIVPGDRRSIRKISITKEKRRPVVEDDEDEEIEEEQQEIEEETQDEEIEEEIEEKTSRKKIKSKKIQSSGGSHKYLITFVVVLVSLVVIGVALSLSYSKAVVTITPKVSNFDISGTFTAKKTQTSTTDDFGYEVVSVTDMVSQTIPATKGPLIQTKAKGTAIIYNNYAATAQTIVAGTRLSNTQGNIYRTTSTVIVPGKKTSPGSISVGIIADQAGDKYNLKLSDLKGDFKLPGYQGTPKYAGFYARLKTDIAGGYSGNKMTINEESKKTAIKNMQDSLKEQLIAKLKESVTPDHILYDGAYSVEYEVPDPVMKGNEDADLVVKGTAYGAIFNSDSLIKYIAGKEIKKFPSDTYDISGDKELVFNISNIKDFSAKKATPLIFTLKGPISITGTFSEEKLKEELKGINLKESNAIFAKYSAIANAYALITPFWLRSFPNSAEKITIEYKH
ncbi:hypothetical protein EB001_05740 [bacterium]|nr:hypothetical protein [bacterium]